MVQRRKKNVGQPRVKFRPCWRGSIEHAKKQAIEFRDAEQTERQFNRELPMGQSWVHVEKCSHDYTSEASCVLSFLHVLVLCWKGNFFWNRPVWNVPPLLTNLLCKYETLTDILPKNRGLPISKFCYKKRQWKVWHLQHLNEILFPREAGGLIFIKASELPWHAPNSSTDCQQNLPCCQKHISPSVAQMFSANSNLGSIFHMGGTIQKQLCRLAHNRSPCSLFYTRTWLYKVENYWFINAI